MGSLGWKKFKFFEEVWHQNGSLPQQVMASCWDSDTSDVWLACLDGLIVCLDRDMSIKTSFKAFKQGCVHAIAISQVGGMRGSLDFSANA